MPVVFSPQVRSKALHYFDTFRYDPQGLPPSLRLEFTTVESLDKFDLSCGSIVPEESREILLQIPQELLRILSANSKGYRYYLAGNKVLALDELYKVVDVIKIPNLDSPKEPLAQVVSTANPLDQFR